MLHYIQYTLIVYILLYCCIKTITKKSWVGKIVPKILALIIVYTIISEPLKFRTYRCELGWNKKFLKYLVYLIINVIIKILL